MEWVLLIGAALLIGVAKTSFGGLASLSVAYSDKLKDVRPSRQRRA